MNVPRYASRAGRLLSSTLGSVAAPPGNRARGIGTIESALASRRRARVIRFGLLAAASFALVAGTGIWLARPASSSAEQHAAAPIRVTLSARGAGATLSPGDLALRDGATLVAGNAVKVKKQGAATLALSTGTRLELDGDTNILAQQLAAEQRFYLTNGALEAKVAKLASGQRFVVETPDAQIEVRGTRFRLEVHGARGACELSTRLQVYEGVVEARANGTVVRVGAGERWPGPCSAEERRSPPPFAEPATEPAREGTPRPHGSSGLQWSHRAKAADASERAHVSSSALVEQNDLFAEGVAARRRGDVDGALGAYGRLIQKYPNSALVENAMVERMRLLGKSNPALGAREAQRYLEHYPGGFARAEAEHMLAGSP